MNYIEVKNVTTGYDGIPLTKHINFNVEKGDYVCIVGENGAGKSTLMKTILKLIPVIKGEILYSDELGKGDIGYLPQQTIVQKDFPASVWEIVLSGCGNRTGLRPFYNREEKRQADKNMEWMGIADKKKRCYRELSGGQQQRVLLARALCATQKMLLLDEPVAGLDPKVTQEMYALIDRLNKERGITVVMISHDIRAALQFANKILHIGDKLFFGTREEYLRFAAKRREEEAHGAV